MGTDAPVFTGAAALGSIPATAAAAAFVRSALKCLAVRLPSWGCLQEDPVFPLWLFFLVWPAREDRIFEVAVRRGHQLSRGAQLSALVGSIRRGRLLAS